MEQNLLRPFILDMGDQIHPSHLCIHAHIMEERTLLGNLWANCWRTEPWGNSSLTLFRNCVCRKKKTKKTHTQQNLIRLIEQQQHNMI